MRKILRLLPVILVLTLLLSACSKKEDLSEDLKEDFEGGEDMVKQLEKPVKGDTLANIKTNHGEIKIKLLPEAAPKAVENFVKHSKDGYYDGVTFHRVINDFMIQGGDPQGTGAGGESIWGENFEDEFDIDARNYRGALSMANAGPNTNGSQFFIVQAKSDTLPEELFEQMESLGLEGGYPKEVIESYKNLGGTPHLDFRHTVFGQVYEGMDIVDKIASVEVDASDRPVEDVVIESIEITEVD